LVLYLPAHHLSEALSASENGPPPPQKPPPKRLCPDDQQAKMLKKMGFSWNGSKWVRGDSAAYAQQRAVARSGNRFARFVDASGAPASGAAALAAAARLEEILGRAREEAVPDRSGPRDRDFKNFCQQKRAPWVYAGVEGAVFVGLSHASGVGWGSELRHVLDHPLPVVGAGLAAGCLLSLCRAVGRRSLPGVEEPDGKLVRVLADAADGNFALPAPNHIRYDSRNWKIFATLGETAAALNVSLLMNGILQPALVRAFLPAVEEGGGSDGGAVPLLAACVAAVAVAFPAALRVVEGTPWDGVPGGDDGIRAECGAVTRAVPGARSYFALTERPTDAADPAEAAAAFVALACGWAEQFDGGGAEQRARQPVLAFSGSLACAAAWQLSGGTLTAPFLARAVAAADTYLCRSEGEFCRANVLMPRPTERDPLDSKGAVSCG